jgi:hypothetical protein
MLHPGAMSEAALRLMFAGGMITGSAGGSVKLDRYRELCELIPPLALFGGCAENRCIPGRMNVDDAVLICDESMHQIPAHAAAWMADHGGAVDAGRAHVEEVQRVRMDPTLLPEKRRLLSAGAGEAVGRRLLASEAAGEERDAVAARESRSSALPRRFERIAQGSLLSWAVEAVVCSDLELDTFHVMLSSFLSRAIVGGKRATGHGLVRPVAARNVLLRRPRESATSFDLARMEPEIGLCFRAHVEARAAEIRSALAEIEA